MPVTECRPSHIESDSHAVKPQCSGYRMEQDICNQQHDVLPMVGRNIYSFPMTIMTTTTYYITITTDRGYDVIRLNPVIEAVGATSIDHRA